MKFGSIPTAITVSGGGSPYPRNQLEFIQLIALGKPYAGPYKLIAPVSPSSPVRMPNRVRSWTGSESRIFATVSTMSGQPIWELKLPPVIWSATCHQVEFTGATGIVTAAVKTPVTTRILQVVP